jgi:hypothetical protein
VITSSQIHILSCWISHFIVYTLYFFFRFIISLLVDKTLLFQASQFEAFVRAAPQGRFVVIDMSMDGKGFWKKWDDASFFGAPFIWTTLHDFGGNVGIKGNVSQINQVRCHINLSFPFFLQKS